MSTDGKNLSRWLALLSRFNHGRPLNKELLTDIEDFFEYYWANNKFSALSNNEDRRFLSELPNSLQKQIFMDFMFKDFLYVFRTHFA